MPIHHPAHNHRRGLPEREPQTLADVVTCGHAAACRLVREAVGPVAKGLADNAAFFQQASVARAASPPHRRLSPGVCSGKY